MLESFLSVSDIVSIVLICLYHFCEPNDELKAIALRTAFTTLFGWSKTEDNNEDNETVNNQSERDTNSERKDNKDKNRKDITEDLANLLRIRVLKYVLFPRIALGFCLSIVELIVICYFNSSKLSDASLTLISISISLFAGICFMCTLGYTTYSTKKFENSNLYFGYLLMYRAVDLHLNSSVLSLAIEYESKTVSYENTVNYWIFIYSLCDVFMCTIHLGRMFIVFNMNAMPYKVS